MCSHLRFFRSQFLPLTPVSMMQVFKLWNVSKVGIVENSLNGVWYKCHWENEKWSAATLYVWSVNFKCVCQLCALISNRTVASVNYFPCPHINPNMFHCITMPSWNLNSATTLFSPKRFPTPIPALFRCHHFSWFWTPGWFTNWGTTNLIHPNT